MIRQTIISFRRDPPRLAHLRREPNELVPKKRVQSGVIKVNVAIQGRKVILVPEKDDFSDWEAAADRLHAEGADHLVYDNDMDSDHEDWNW